MKFDVNTKAWIKLENGSFKDFQIIGSHGDKWRLLLLTVPEPIPYERYVNYSFIAHYKVPPEYKDCRVIEAGDSCVPLFYFGKECSQCQNTFDNLGPEIGFICWKCEV